MIPGLFYFLFAGRMLNNHILFAVSAKRYVKILNDVCFKTSSWADIQAAPHGCEVSAVYPHDKRIGEKKKHSK